MQRADQRRSLVEGLVKHWHQYSRSLSKLQKFLSETQLLLPPAGPARCSLQQLRRSLQDLQVRRAEQSRAWILITFSELMETIMKKWMLVQTEDRETTAAD